MNEIYGQKVQIYSAEPIKALIGGTYPIKCFQYPKICLVKLYFTAKIDLLSVRNKPGNHKMASKGTYKNLSGKYIS